MMKKNYSTESDLVAAMKKALTKRVGGKWIKIHGGPYQEKGLSDLLGCVNGRFIAIEVKLPGKERKLTKYQSKFLEEIESQGGLAFLASDIEQAIQLIGGDPNEIQS